MTKFFNLLANIFFPVRYALIVICVISFFSIVYLLILSPINTQELYLTPCLLLFLWGLVLFVLCHSFHGVLHSSKTEKLNRQENTGWFSRLKEKLAKIFLWGYSFFFIVLIFISLHFSLKVLTL
jgi:hypothetical protein